MVMAPQSNDLSFSMEDFENALDQQEFSSVRGDRVRGTIVEHTRDGAFVDIGGKSAAFLPVKEASLRTVLDLSAILPVGESYEFMIVREENAEGQVTISLRQRLLQQVWAKLKEQEEANTTLEVKVTGTNRGGVTVDVEGLRGFIPRSQLNEGEDLDALRGKLLRAKLIEVNATTKKVVLSERRAEQMMRMSQFSVGQLVSGQITGLKPFGAFVSFGGTTGLLHVGQISEKRVQSVETVLSVGQAIQAMIVDIEEGRGRIALSTKVLENFPGEVLENMADVIGSAESRAERARKKLEVGQS
jgi:small subunit ribosomal protein S1